MSDVIFSAVITEGIIIKKIIEVFNQSFSKLMLTIREDGIFSRMSDAQHAMLFDLNLPRDNFTEFILKEKELFFGLNLSHATRVFASMKKKDSVRLEIQAAAPSRLRIVILPKGRDYVDTGFIIMEEVRVIEIDLPCTYPYLIKGLSSKFNKMCKELNAVSKEDVHVCASTTYISFNATIEEVLGKETIYGYKQDECQNIVSSIFRIQDFLKLGKLSGFSPAIYFSVKENAPLCIYTDIGTSGRCTVYIRSKCDILNGLDMNI